MELGWLSHVVEADGPFASVYADVSRTVATARKELDTRFEELGARLIDQGSPSELAGRIFDRIREPTGRAGAHGRGVVANAHGVLLDRVLPAPPLRDSAHYGPVPHLMPLVRAFSAAVPYVLVEANSSGADVVVVSALGEKADEHAVEGDHDVLHKAPGGGWGHKRMHTRVEDSWDRNADAVAEDLDEVVRRYRPSVVLLAADPRIRHRIHEHASPRLGQLIVDLPGGGRADGVSDEARSAAIEEALDAQRVRHEMEVLAVYAQERGQRDRAVAGVDATVAALRAGSVQTLLLHDDPSSTLTLWGGPDPLHVANSPETLATLGVRAPFQERADALLLRALVGQSGDLELVRELPELQEGIGALLRYPPSAF